MSKVKIKKIIIIIICVVLVLSVIGAVCVFSLIPKNISQFNLADKKQKSVVFDDSFVPYVLAGNSVLLVDEQSGAIAITDEDGKIVFNSHSQSASSSKNACVLSLVLRDKKGNSYVLNSSVNSADKGNLKVSTDKKNDVTLTFSFCETVEADMTHIIPVKFTEENGGIKVSVDMKKVSLQGGFCIEKISILPGLFSEKSPAGECFYTIPDGCGAQVDLTAACEESFSHKFEVYGSDIAFGEYSQGAFLPVFSLSKGSAMLTAVIENGDAISSIYVKRNKNIGGDLYNTFIITPYGKVNGRIVKGESFEGVVSQTYFLTVSGEKNYNTVSVIARDSLTRRGYLPSEISDAFVDYPFFITAIGSENGKGNDVYTTFEDAAEMVALLKSRGVRSIALRFSGAGVKGLNTGPKNSDKLSNTLGGEKAYNKLCELAHEKNSSVWYDVNFAATPAQRGNNKTDIYKDFREYLSKDKVNSNLGTYNNAYSNISTIYKTVSKFESANVCINDLSYLLYTDVVGNVNRQVALENLKEKIQAFGVNGNLMLSSPAIYLMNQVDAVFSVTQSSLLEEYNGVKTVPLLQMVLHGSVIYGSEPINLFEDGQDAVLKAVEYGASPSFVFTHNKCAVLDYGVYATQTAKFYSSAKRMLPLMDMKITSHEQVLSGVYKVTYDYSKVVYINYNPSVVEVNGILVSAKDFVII